MTLIAYNSNNKPVAVPEGELPEHNFKNGLTEAIYLIDLIAVIDRQPPFREEDMEKAKLLAWNESADSWAENVEDWQPPQHTLFEVDVKVRYEEEMIVQFPFCKDLPDEKVKEFVRMPSGDIVVRVEGGESLWFDKDGNHPKSKLITRKVAVIDEEQTETK